MNYVALGSRTRIGPFHGPWGKVVAGTDLPPCEISSKPRRANWPAICLTRGIRLRQSSGARERATSDGQALACSPRWAIMASKAASICESVGCVTAHNFSRQFRQSFQSQHKRPSGFVPRQMRFWHVRQPLSQTLRQTIRWRRW